MTRTIIDLHVLQSVPPSNLNRDDTGTPKTAVYGGVRRARVSSQAWKRATRKSFHDLLDPSELGVRTKRVAELLSDRIRGLDASIDEPTAWNLAAETVQNATGSKIEVPKRRGGAKDDDAPAAAPEAKYLMFLSARQLDGLAELAVDGRDDITTFFKDKDNKARAKQIANARHSVDIALFGRMVADGADINVDAAAQVAHALSVHQVENESDYYTAVDDHKEREDDDLGAGMIGTVEFNSATLYRYAALDVDQLRGNLGKGLRDDEPVTEPVRRAVEAFVQGFITSMPTGKVNTFGNHTVPDAVVVKIRSARPISFAGAFEEPCKADAGSGYLQQAAARLADYVPEIEQAYGCARSLKMFTKVTRSLSTIGCGTTPPERPDGVVVCRVARWCSVCRG
ncbi:type I-E CRISPR-associated protein Cas7/Cse4/CasC [Actinomadura opuntiae]|uniref:type I-E CRISPR-associated protein Cas7/Cse4/CasC n=1 Tax=Actinomadura sp. OS1-43 TaxID=604315 RepID=UPI00255AC95D|nr:type I-E CRISPR-associated protein Cas7/Cse4/CasC [Actinomadura sp. OS1-43]MDL4813085.1 type I-E CRISPR-associated protein Cas7/Cse4/CasC [Actinomadura sp. OS1-43]